MALILNVDQSRSAKSSKEVKQPSNVTKAAQGKINPLESKESLQGRVTALTSRSEEFKEYAAALTLFALFTGAIGLFIPLFLIVSLGFLTGVTVCGIESKAASREAKEAKSQLDHLQAREAREASLREAEFQKLLGCESAQFEEHGIFRPEEFHAMLERKDGNFGAFSSYDKDYPYEIPGVVKNKDESLPVTIVGHFVTQATSFNIRVTQRLLNLDKATEPQSRTRQICAFLKLLGDRDSHINTDINSAISKINPDVTLSGMKTGTLTTDCPTDKFGKEEIGFKVEDEEVGLYFCESNVTHPIARYKTSRVVTVSAPDSAGNVEYTIKRTFTRI